MLEYIVIRYAHFIAIFVLFSLLVCQHLLLKPQIATEQAKQLRFIDRFYGLSALLVLVMGGLLWFSVGKPAAFYSQNPIFHIKVSLFVLAGLLSIAPTVFYGRAVRSGESHIAVPKIIIGLVRAQLLLILILPLLAVLMALGIGA